MHESARVGMCESYTYLKGIGVHESGAYAQWVMCICKCYIHNYVHVIGAHPNILRDDLGCMKVMHTQRILCM